MNRSFSLVVVAAVLASSPAQAFAMRFGLRWLEPRRFSAAHMNIRAARPATPLPSFEPRAAALKHTAEVPHALPSWRKTHRRGSQPMPAPSVARSPVLTFVWNNKGPLAVAAGIAAFVHDPRPFLDAATGIAARLGQFTLNSMAHAIEEWPRNPWQVAVPVVILVLVAVRVFRRFKCRRLPRNAALEAMIGG